MKKAIAFICVLTLCLSLCACGKATQSSSLPEESKQESVFESGSVTESISESISESKSISESQTIRENAVIVPYSDDAIEAPVAEEYESFAEKCSQRFKERMAIIDDTPDTPDSPYWMPEIDNETDIEELIQKQTVLSEDAWYFELDNIGGFYWPIHVYNTFGSLSFLRQIDEDNFYTVYRVCGGGRLYVFFQMSDEVAIPVPQAIKMRYQPDTYTYESIGKLNLGDSIDEVIKIDSSVQKYKNMFDDYYCHTTIHLVSEGIVIIDYEKKNNEIVISGIELCSDGIYRRGTGKGDSRFDGTIQMKLLPQDYPPAN